MSTRLVSNQEMRVLYRDGPTLLGLSCPVVSLARNSFGEEQVVQDRGVTWQTILAVGRQDTDCGNLSGPDGTEILAASSDHLIVQTPKQMSPGEEIAFEPGYAALLSSMTSPFVKKVR